VIFLSSTERGETLLRWLEGQECDIVLAETSNAPVDNLPSYDLGISFLYVHKIPASEFIVPYRWINFHPGLLPDFRGRNLAYHAIMSGAGRFGATMHYMDETYDTGEIIATRSFEIQPNHTAGDLVEGAHAILESLFREYVPRALKGKLPSVQQGRGRYFKKHPISNELVLTPDQERLVRALTVHPKFHATTSINGRMFKFIPVENTE